MHARVYASFLRCMLSIHACHRYGIFSVASRSISTSPKYLRELFTPPQKAAFQKHELPTVSAECMKFPPTTHRGDFTNRKESTLPCAFENHPRLPNREGVDMPEVLRSFGDGFATPSELPKLAVNHQQ